MGDTILINEDFHTFELGDFPFDREHSAMGEYHFYPEKGYKGIWYDPITNWSYRGPSWMVTDPALDGRHCMEQQRIAAPGLKKAVPVLRAGETDWKDYTVTVELRPAIDSQISGIAFRYQTSMMHYGFFLVKGGVELHRVNKLERTVIANAALSWSTDEFHTLSVTVKGNHFSCFLDGALGFPAEHERLYLAEAQNSGLRDYAKTNSREYFADCFVYWITYSGNEKRMETFRSAAPETYAYMEKLAANNWGC